MALEQWLCVMPSLVGQTIGIGLRAREPLPLGVCEDARKDAPPLFETSLRVGGLPRCGRV